MGPAALWALALVALVPHAAALQPSKGLAGGLGRRGSAGPAAPPAVMDHAEEDIKPAEELKAAVPPGSSPALQSNLDEVRKRLSMPLSLMVGQEDIKQALLLTAINPAIGGVLLSGGKGTGKSAMARGLQRLMPPIEVVKGSKYNVDPTRPDELDSFLEAELEASGKALADLETEVVDCPFMQIPLNCLEDRLIGSVDVEDSLKAGKAVFSPGLLASAHRGILYVDDINLLDPELANTLLSVVSDGYVIVEREGVSVRYPCRPLLVATFNAEEQELREHLRDRIGISLSADLQPLTAEQRPEAVRAVLRFSEATDPKSAGEALKDDEVEMRQEIADAERIEEELRSRIVFAREYLKDTRISDEQVMYLCEEAVRAGCQGQRAEIFAAQVALASAALNDRPVASEDLRTAVKLAILPRGSFMNTPQDMAEPPEPPPPPPPPPPSQEPQAEEQQDNGEDQNEEDQEDKEDEKEEEQQEEEEQEEDDSPPEVPEEFMFDAVGTPVDPDLIKFATKQKQGRGGRRGKVMNMERGRYIKPVLPRGKQWRIAVDATLRTAARHQRSRRARAVGTANENKNVFIEQEDVRAKKMAKKAGSLTIFAVDASGSMALNRMNAAKGAAISLLTEAYQSRDKVALIPFQGDKAEVLLPPTRSISLAKNRLDTMPCGGGSPLAHALTQASRTALNAMKSGDTGRAVIVLISDGRANVPLGVSLGEEDVKAAEDAGEAGAEKKKLTTEEKKAAREALKEEVLTVARQMREFQGINLLVIDTENKFVSTGMAKEIAKAAGGRYHYIPKATGEAISSVASAAIADMRQS